MNCTEIRAAGQLNVHGAREVGRTYNLQGGDLAAARVAAHFGVSVRTLHNAFRDSEHTYARTVMRLRVDALHGPGRQTGLVACGRVVPAGQGWP